MKNVVDDDDYHDDDNGDDDDDSYYLFFSFLELINYMYTTYVFIVVKTLYVYYGPVAFIYKL